MRGVHCINTEDQFVQLCRTKLQQVQLIARPDSIRWNLTADLYGRYLARSAYPAQFHERCLQPDLEAAWKARAEGKVRFLVWLMLQNRN